VPIPASVGDLPVVATLAALGDALTRRHSAVLVAAPGAGKTTVVPLWLLDQPWLGDRRIVMLEPRRLATRAAAQRMASLLGERVGQTPSATRPATSATSATGPASRWSPKACSPAACSTIPNCPAWAS
jgi:hypothetical protein